MGRSAALGSLLLGLLMLTGCNTGMTAVREPKVLVAPNDRAVLVVVQPSTNYLSAAVLDADGHCLGYARSGAWFATRLSPGTQLVHLKEPDNHLTVKLDLAAGKTYFVEPRLSRNNFKLALIQPGTDEWKRLDGLLSSGTQYKVDRKQCDETLPEMVWMPGQDMKQILSVGAKKAEAGPPAIKPDDGVRWRGSAAKSR